MDDRDDRLAHYPFVVVRIGCRNRSRRGSYRLARLSAKFGPEISLRDNGQVLLRLHVANPQQAGKTTCGAYLADLEQPRPPDARPGLVRLVKG